MTSASTTVFTNIHTLVTMAGERTSRVTPLHDAAVIIKGNVIDWIGATVAIPEVPGPHTVIDLRDHLVLPGLVNTHHHLYQTLTRAVAQDDELFDWLKT